MHTPHLWLGFTFNMRIPVWEQGSLLDSAHPWDSPLGSRQFPGAVQLEFLEAQKKAAASGGRFTAQLITQGMGLTTASPLMVALFVVFCGHGIAMDWHSWNLWKIYVNQKDPAMAKERNKFWNTTRWLQPLCWISIQVCQRIPCSYGRLRQASLSKSAWSRNDDVVEVMELDVEEDVDMALKWRRT